MIGYPNTIDMIWIASAFWRAEGKGKEGRTSERGKRKEEAKTKTEGW